ncbi:expressed unknown protein [Ectocarpus siliculosus]|uniref:Uncharacterized protein n=1 Tax=Ectocarpus siliculosus TaxID=2880 RepID=D7FH59_ECTSI|nr:expressed unknown protein [Ectocarpus siliculosus]|eukprot:CBJ28434.1 expressed unknown protein [Ectocarpus siliculosus]
MKASGTCAGMALLTMRLAVSAAATTETCQKLVVDVESMSSGTHTGSFYEVGTTSDGRPVLKTNGDYSLQFIAAGSMDDEDYLTYTEPDADSLNEPMDEDLEIELLSIADNESFRRSLTTTCGYWVIGKIGDNDVAMYPMLKVADCAIDPTAIDTDSAWFLQATHESEEDYSIGEVTMTLEDYDCDSLEAAAVIDGDGNEDEDSSVEEEEEADEEVEDASVSSGNQLAVGGGMGLLNVVLSVGMAMLGLVSSLP